MGGVVQNSLNNLQPEVLVNIINNGSVASSASFSDVYKFDYPFKFYGIMYFYVMWEAHSDGERGICVKNTHIADIRKASGSGITTRQTFCFPVVNRDENNSVTFMLFQNSGISLNYNYMIRIVSLKRI